MRNINFSDKKLKKKYDELISNNYFINQIINDLIMEYDNPITINAIINLSINKTIIIQILADNDNITLSCDFNNNRTYLSSSNWDHITVYSFSNIKRHYIPLGKEYKNDTKSVLWCYKDKINPHKYQYKDIDNPDKVYEINIRQEENDTLSDKKIIDSLLTSNTKITRIRDLLVLINSFVDLNNCELRIKDNDDLESNIIVFYGTLTKYVEYFERDGKEYKIYLEDGSFYKDTVIKKEKEDDPVGFVKKKGKING